MNIRKVCMVLAFILVFTAGCSKKKINSNIAIPSFIIWNNTAYVGVDEFHKSVGKQIGTDSEGREIYQNPDKPDSDEIILNFGGTKLIYNPYDFKEDNAVSQVLNANPTLGDAKNIPFPRENGKSAVELQSKDGKSIPMNLETKISQTSALLYEVTLSAEWAETKNGITQNKKHVWIYDVSPGEARRKSDEGDALPSM